VIVSVSQTVIRNSAACSVFRFEDAVDDGAAADGRVGRADPTELRVAELAAQDRPNPGIAAELFLWSNTVQGHVSHILAKPGAGSRTDTAAETRRHQPPSISGSQGEAA
jgi:DNA-binding NarL/FixJ family response regulator